MTICMGKANRKRAHLEMKTLLKSAKAANALCGRFLQQSVEPTIRRVRALFEIKKPGARVGSRPLLSGAPEGIRTSDLPLRGGRLSC